MTGNHAESADEGLSLCATPLPLSDPLQPTGGGHLLRLAGGGELSHGKTSCWLEHIPVTASGKTRRLDSRHPHTTTADWGLCCPKNVTRLGSSTAGHCAVEPIRRALPKGWGATDVSETPAQWRRWGQRGGARTEGDYRAGASWLGQGLKPPCGKALRRWVGSGGAQCVEAFS